MVTQLIVGVEGADVRNYLTFILNGKTQRVDNIAGDMTLLKWLRDQKSLVGSKEGCAEGDCGACTVAIVKTDDSGNLIWRSVNACIVFMGMLEGCAVITVEGLNGPNSELHPCQKALIDFHGSQCGFCTPGFVMSLFTAWSNKQGLMAEDIDDTLAGNLCRCTGYRPIVEAGLSLKNSKQPQWELDRNEILKKELLEINSSEPVEITDGKNSFSIPTNHEDFSKTYADQPSATIVSGATDIGLWVTKQNRDLPNMIWTGRVKEFNKIDEQDDFIIIRPAVTHQEAMAKLGNKWPTIKALWKRFGSVQVRNSGTVCGNLANGSPIGDLPPALIALESLIELTNKNKKRKLPLEEFFIEYGRQDRHAGEYVSGIFVPNKPGDNFRCYKLSKRFDQDISAVMMGANLIVEKTKITMAKICFGGMAGTPKRATEVEKALLGQPFEPQSFIKASKNINKDFDPLTDVRGSADYRHKAAQNLVMKYGYELTGSFVPNLADRNQVENLVS